MAMTTSDADDDQAARIWRELVESSVECELCNEPYDESDEHLPRLLSCGHTFCQSCLEDWASVGAVPVRGSHGSGGDPHAVATATMDCPTCRQPTTFSPVDGMRSLPRNFELLRVRQEMETQTPQQLERLREVWTTQVLEKERLAQAAEEHARAAQQESIEAAHRAAFLAKQVEINEQEKRRAQELAAEARHRALVASEQAEALQAETERLKQRLQHEAQQLQRVTRDATSAAAEAAELHSRAEALEQQVELVRAQLSLHSGRHDPSKLVVLVVEPTTVGSWLLPYTRYAVISIAGCSTQRQAPDPYQAAKMWTRMRHVAEPSSSVKVYRRYSDFVWLHHELERQFPFELIPSIPAKQLFFNKDKEFVGERMRSLQAFIREVLRQPTLAVSAPVRAFLLSTTEELEQLRNASLLQSDDDSFLREVEECEANGTASSSSAQRSTASRPPPPSMTSAASSPPPVPPKSSSSWAWGAVSAITSSAAKLVTSTGSALTSSISGATANGNNAGADDVVEVTMSESLTIPTDATVSPEHREAIERRRKYVEIAQAHQSTTTKGSHLARVQRQSSHHLHRICELMHEMDALDKQHIKKRRDRLAMSMDRSTYTARQVEDDARACLESRSFQARASDMFSSLSLAMKNDAECMEYALLEISRMQTLRLGGIEDAFSRVRSREETLGRAISSVKASPPSSRTGSFTADGGQHTASPSSPLLALRHEELQQRRRELAGKVEEIDPSRSQFVLETLQKSVNEMYHLAHTRRKLHEGSYQQLRSAASQAT